MGKFISISAWCKRGAFQGCLLKTCACLHCYSQCSHPHLVTGYCHQRMLLSPVILEEKVVKLRLCCLFCFPTSYLYGLFPFFLFYFFPLPPLFQIGWKCIPVQRHSTCFFHGVWGKDTKDDQTPGKCLTWRIWNTREYFISEMTNRERHGKRAENNGWDREGGLGSSVLPLLTRRKGDFLLHGNETDLKTVLFHIIYD